MTGVFTYRQIDKLKSEFDIEVIYLRNFSPKRSIKSYRTYNSIKVTTISLPLLMVETTSLKLLSIFIYSKIVKLLLRNYDYDILHAVGGAFSGLIASEIKRKNRKLIVQYNGSDVNVSLKKYRISKWVISNINKVDHYVFVSKNLKDVFYIYFKGSKNNFSIIHRGVNLDEFKPFSKGHTKIRFLYLGGFSPIGFSEYDINQKGGVTLLNAWKKIDSKKNAELRFGGNNTTEKILAKYNLKNPHVVFIGKLSPEKVKEEYDLADVVIIPSLSEGLPNVLFESMASGLAVIGTDVGGISEILTDNKGGYLINPNNEKELVDRISTLIQNKEKIIEFGIYNRNFSELYLDSSLAITRLSLIYEKLIDNEQNEQNLR